MKRRGRIDKEIILDHADAYQVEMMFERFFKKSYIGDDNSWQQLVKQVVNAIPPGEFSTAELQGFFLEYTFYLERNMEDGFKELINRIDTFRADIKKSRLDWTMREKSKLDQLVKKNRTVANEQKTVESQIKVNGNKNSNKKKKNKNKNSAESAESTELSSKSSSSAPSSPSLSTTTSTDSSSIEKEN
jgi:hypothetical protein